MKLGNKTRIGPGGPRYARTKPGGPTELVRATFRGGFVGTLGELSAETGLDAATIKWVFKSVRPLVVEVLPRKRPGGSTWKWKGAA